jgi:dTDP-4-amino-4,6-dideoxygalactose transaminase
MNWIPLNKPYWGKKEQKIVLQALEKSIGSGDGPYNLKLVESLMKLTHAKYAIPVTSCTHGLELALRALRMTGRLFEGDEVILPSFTMSSTANAILLAGAKPVFVDIDDTFCNIDPTDIKRKITAKTRGIMVVHYAGMPCKMEEILAIAQKNKLWVVEDAAHAIGATYKGKALGTWGDIGVFSFHGTKNISCGEGGAVLTGEKEFVDAMDIFRANGTNRKAYLDGVIDKYSWVDIGTSFYLSDILASIVNVQIKQIKTINIKRNQIASIYLKSFIKYANVVKLPKIPDGAKPNWHIFALRFYDAQKRSVFIKSMRDKGVEVSYHYVPLHSSVMGLKLVENAKDKRNQGKERKFYSDLPVTDVVSRTLVRLPIYPGLTKKELHYIITSAKNILDELI